MKGTVYHVLTLKIDQIMFQQQVTYFSKNRDISAQYECRVNLMHTLPS